MIKRVDIYSAIAAIVVVAVWMQYSRYNDQSRPASEWFEVDTLNVPDFVEGENPIIAYQRTVHNSFTGSYKIVILHAEDEQGAIECLNSKEIDYIAGRNPPAAWKLSRFFGDAEWTECSKKLKPGEFQIRASWDVKVPGLDTKTYLKLSNVFWVLPKEVGELLDPG